AIPLGAYVLTLTPAATRAVVNRVKRRRGTHNERRAVFERQITRLLLDQWRAREGLGEDDPLPDDLDRLLHRERSYVAAVERMWPILTPTALLHDLFSVPALLRLAAHNVLEPAEIKVLERPRERRLADVAWSEDDVALLDEAAVHLGPVPSKARPLDLDREDTRALFERALEDVGDVDPLMRADLLDHLSRWTAEPNGDDQAPDLANRTFGHVLVDEAQDLSPMQARMIGRRVPNGSMTIVGDLGQASGDHAARSWEDLIHHLPHRRQARIAELSVNYRTPSEVMELAARILETATPGLAPPRSVRSAGEWPTFTQVPASELVTAAAEAARTQLGATARGRVAVIAASALVEELRAALDAPDTGSAVLEQPIAVFTVEGVKGLEFDAVVVVEPADIVEERSNGLRGLYVALTRTTRALHVVHHRPLPDMMARCDTSPPGGSSR
ncbi:MAG: ATP-binding domain-containing protein, partial [Actinomycetota bacterium]|nr:ATP-binding domain-containing protein [Actinomycetota bacterium]